MAINSRIRGMFTKKKAPALHQGGALFFFGGDAQSRPFMSWQEIDKYVGECGLVSAIINRIAAGAGSCVLRATDAREKVRELPPAFVNPSAGTSFFELLSFCVSSVLKYGCAVLYAPKDTRRRSLDKVTLTALNTSLLEIQMHDRIPLGGYPYANAIKSLKYNGVTLQPSDCLFILDKQRRGANLFFDRYGHPIGTTQEAATAIKKFVNISRVEDGMIKNKGVQGIFHYKGERAIMTNEQRAETEQRLTREFGWGYGQNRFAVSFQEMGFIDVSKSLRDILPYERFLKIIDEICQVFNYPPDLVSTSGNRTFSNYETASRLAYQNCIIPFTNFIIREICQGLEIGDLTIEADFSNVHELKEDKREAVETKQRYLDYYARLVDLQVWTTAQFRAAVVQLEKEL